MVLVYGTMTASGKDFVIFFVMVARILCMLMRF
jgi:hypothetical protein